ncbi:hypothetical protein SAMN05660662_0216 [Blastococcus aurantiacus]|uniref:Exo-alpha-sialidase n=1 Tax=Blastococcus aurantiacus TaxID=1550231 RepID=A0A1G7R9V5_9ACTN|nr:exo-alpha-sialidase [Blastococcus aurantiacus]SDG07542.1 hypothetical protein SAMN05660662_0216 [Blastococcus aurantiacus]
MHTSRSKRYILTAAATTLAAALTGCSDAAPAPADAASAADADRLPAGHVHGLAYDRGDDTLLVATHQGLVEVSDDGTAAQLGPVIDLMGFTATGSDRYLASGHPGLRVDLPNPVGLISSTDGGQTWTPLSRAGESDFHALTALSGGGVIGYDGTLRRSTDGRTWEDLTIPAEPHTLAAAPEGSTVLATTAQGVLRSTDAGGNWTPVNAAPLLQVLAWADDGTTAVGVSPDGDVWASTDAAATWRRTGDVGAAPHAVAVATRAGGPMEIAAVTDDGLLQSVDGGQAFTLLLGY